MKIAILLNLVAYSLAGCTSNTIDDDTQPLATADIIDYINNAQSSWIAHSEWSGGLSVADGKALVASQSGFSIYPEFSWGDIFSFIFPPSSFDSRTQWPGCVGAIRDQGGCGSCWAFGAAEALSDRFCIASKGELHLQLSPQYLVNCHTQSYGCSGGFPNLAWNFIESKGIPIEACVPYTAKNGVCPTTCANSKCMIFFRANHISTYSTPLSIQLAVMSGGPVEVTFAVYQDFFSYKSGIYIHTWGGLAGYHAVKLIGWGKQGNSKYWICANSWGTGWGQQGFFWIGFGQVGIDSNGVAGTPILY